MMQQVPEEKQPFYTLALWIINEANSDKTLSEKLPIVANKLQEVVERLIKATQEYEKGKHDATERD